MKQSLLSTTLVLAAFALGSCTGSGSCEGLPCGSEGSSMQDDVTMLQVSLQRQQKSVAASSSESVTMVAANMQDKQAENVTRKKSYRTKGFEFRHTGGGQCTDEDGNLVLSTDAASLGWSSCTGETTGFTQGACTSVDECAAECTTNPDCGALGYWWGNCWLYAKMSKPYTTVNTNYPYFECYTKVEICTPGTTACLTGEYLSSTGRSYKLAPYGNKVYCDETTPSSSPAAVKKPVKNKKGTFYPKSGKLKLFGKSATYAEGVLTWSNGVVWTYKGPYTPVAECFKPGTALCFEGKYMSSTGRQFQLAVWQKKIICDELTSPEAPSAVSNPVKNKKGTFKKPKKIKMFGLTGVLEDGVISWSNGVTWTWVGPLV